MVRMKTAAVVLKNESILVIGDEEQTVKSDATRTMTCCVRLLCPDVDVVPFDHNMTGYLQVYVWTH